VKGAFAREDLSARPPTEPACAGSPIRVVPPSSSITLGRAICGTGRCPLRRALIDSADTETHITR